MAKINSESTYNKALNEVYKLMQKGEENLTLKDSNKISSIAKSIQDYEKVHYPFPFPKTINEMVELKMFEKKWSKNKLAEILGIGASKLSQILNNKREPDVTFLKAIHEKLGVDGNFILEKV